MSTIISKQSNNGFYGCQDTKAMIHEKIMVLEPSRGKFRAYFWSPFLLEINERISAGDEVPFERIFT